MNNHTTQYIITQSVGSFTFYYEKKEDKTISFSGDLQKAEVFYSKSEADSHYAKLSMYGDCKIVEQTIPLN